MPKVEDIFSQLNGAKYFPTLDLQAGYHHIPLDEASYPKDCPLLTIWEVQIHQSTFWTHTSSSILPGTYDRNIEGFQLCHCLFG